MFLAFNRNHLRLNAKIIAIKRNKKIFFLYTGLKGLPYMCEEVRSLFVCVRVSDKIYFVTVSQSFKGTHCTISLILLAVINLFIFYLQNITLFEISKKRSPPRSS